MIKILSPVDKVGEVEDLIEAGADKLYCGVLWDEWVKRYPIVSINRRPAKICNLESFDDLKSCIEIAHSHDVPVSLTINEHYYIQEQYPLLRKFVERAIDAGVDAFIISDLALLRFLKEDMDVEVDIEISTGGTVFNSEAADFYRKLGADMIHLPRNLTVKEMEKIIEDSSDISLSAFILNARCPNVDGFCTFNHVQSKDPSYKNACMLPYSVQLSSNSSSGSNTDGEEMEEVASITRQKAWERFHMDDIPCGACAIYEFERMGLEYVKIVGRGNKTKRKINDIKFIRTLLIYLRREEPTADKFKDVTQRLYKYIYKLPCRTVMCYYPKVGKKWSQHYTSPIQTS